LKINSALQGTVHSTNHIFAWNDVPLLRGENTIEVRGTQNGKVYTDSCSWTYKADREKP
jgi:hypothetical protein